jgi:hypothetical protein
LPIEFGLLLQEAYNRALLTDDTEVATEMVEEHYARDHAARMARYK